MLRGVDLEVARGEITLLVGQSGCGKTTLLSVVAGLLDPTAGEVEVLGERPAAMAANARILFRRRNLGFVFQQFQPPARPLRRRERRRAAAGRRGETLRSR